MIDSITDEMSYHKERVSAASVHLNTVHSINSYILTHLWHIHSCQPLDDQCNVMASLYSNSYKSGLQFFKIICVSSWRHIWLVTLLFDNGVLLYTIALYLITYIYISAVYCVVGSWPRNPNLVSVSLWYPLTQTNAPRRPQELGPSLAPPAPMSKSSPTARTLCSWEIIHSVLEQLWIVQNWWLFFCIQCGF